MEHGGVGDDWSSGWAAAVVLTTTILRPLDRCELSRPSYQRPTVWKGEGANSHLPTLQTAIVNADHDGVIQILGY